MIYITSDLHFNDRNIIDYSNRPFDSVEEMNKTLVNNWNSVVSSKDTVYVLGDFFNGPQSQIKNILKQLNGEIILVRGNHDTKASLLIYSSLGITIQDIAFLEYKGRFFVMCHFPHNSKELISMVKDSHSEVIWLYGHIHYNAPKGYVDGTYHVGVDTNNFIPVSIQKIWEESWPEEIMTPEIQKYKEYYSKEE